MFRKMQLIIRKDKLDLFDFLKDNPTKVYVRGDNYCFLYVEPLGCYLSNFVYDGITFTASDDTDYLNKWELVRDKPLSFAPDSLLEVLEDLEMNRLREKRQGTAVELSGWIFRAIVDGIWTKEEAAYFIRLMFVNGYDFEQIIGLYAAIVRNTSLSRFFITTARKLYEGV